MENGGLDGIGRIRDMREEGNGWEWEKTDLISTLSTLVLRQSRGSRITPAGEWDVKVPRRGGGSTTVRPRVS